MAEEIALHLVLDAAAGIVADETPELELFTGEMPKSRFDFDLLHDVLYQDKERYAKLPLMILLHRADLRLPRSLILKTEGFA